MRVIEIKAYTFEELSEDAQKKAYQNFLNQEREYFWMEDNLESLRQGLKHFGFELTDWRIDYYNATHAYLKIEYNNSYGYVDEEDEIQGVRLWKYLQSYLTYRCKYDKKFKPLLDGNGPFTGYCMDENFLDPIREFIKKPDNRTFKELMKDCAHEVMKGIEQDYEYQNSFEFFKSEAEGNELEFTEDGEQI